MGYCLIRLDEPAFVTVSKPMQTGFGIHHRLESCGCQWQKAQLYVSPFHQIFFNHKNCIFSSTRNSFLSSINWKLWKSTFYNENWWRDFLRSCTVSNHKVSHKTNLLCYLPNRADSCIIAFSVFKLTKLFSVSLNEELLFTEGSNRFLQWFQGANLS